MYQRVGAKAFKKDLTNSLALDAHLGYPHQKFPTVHIAGTNGKGSTSHMIAAVLQAHGLKVGLYTSPHYRDFRERIKINGTYISKQAVVKFVDRHRNAFSKIQPSFFEITVAMAFDYFAACKVDIAVIETGLGGRLDSTNIITPLLSVITNIGWDHMNFLGDTLPLIAGEKAGIIKAGIPVVIGESLPETLPVFEHHSRKKRSSLYLADTRYSAEPVARDMSEVLGALGDYQRLNLVTSLTSLEVLADDCQFLNLRPDAVREGLRNLVGLTRFMGRWQILGTDPLIIADSAHNEPGLQRAMAQLAAYPRKQLHVVLGAVNDKDLSKMLRLLPREARYYFCRPDIPRGLSATQLMELAASCELRGRAYASVRYALRAARRAAAPKDVIYVGGSTFTVAEVVPRRRVKV
jgi:dihydrofolate synthase/folylpolyglutamate synthase